MDGAGDWDNKAVCCGWFPWDFSPMFVGAGVSRSHGLLQDKEMAGNSVWAGREDTTSGAVNL